MFQLNKNWQGYGLPGSACYPNAGIDPKCICVDESREFIINVTDETGVDAGLVVVDKKMEVFYGYNIAYAPLNSISLIQSR